METNFLGAFLLVAETGSMSEAARRLDLTPAAVAQQMHALEREFGTPLLARVGRTVRPTESGYRLLEKAQALMRDVSNLKAMANQTELTGELRIGAINTALHSVLPDILARFAKGNPQVKVFIESSTTDKLYSMVDVGLLDAAVCLHPSFKLPKTFDWALLRQEPLVVIAPRQWAHREAHELLSNEALVRYDRSLGGGRQAERYLRGAGIVPKERFELSSLLAIGMMVARGLGVSIIPDIASPLLAKQNVVRIPLPVETEARRFGVLWLRSSPRLRLVQRLCRCAADVVASARAA